MYFRKSFFRIGFSGDHILENSQFGLGYFALSCSYSSDGVSAWTSTVGSEAREVGLGCYKMGDVVGCGIDWIRGRYFFTLNGQREGKIQSTT